MTMNEQQKIEPEPGATPRPKRRTRRQITSAILEQFMQGGRSLDQIAQALNLSAEDLATWIANPANVKTLARLSQLQNVSAQMLMNKYRSSAAAQLIGIATEIAARGQGDERSSKHAAELARKACVDLLKTNLDAFAIEPANPDDPQLSAFGTSRAPSERVVLRAMEELAKREPGAES